MGFEVGQLDGAEVGAAEARQFRPCLDVLAKPGVELGDAAGHCGANPTDPLLVKIDAPSDAEHLLNRFRLHHLDA